LSALFATSSILKAAVSYTALEVVVDFSVLDHFFFLVWALEL